MKNILVFGDSITYGKSDAEGGWVARLRSFLEQKDPDTKVYNLGIPGDTTADLLLRFSAETRARLREDSETMIIFAIGINDSCFIHSQNGLAVNPKQFQSNLSQLVEQAKVFSSNIIFIGLTPVDESKTAPDSWNADKSYRNESIAAFDRIIKTACTEREIPFIETWEKFKNLDYRKLLSDGLHPNTEGHKLIFETVKEAVSL